MTHKIDLSLIVAMTPEGIIGQSTHEFFWRLPSHWDHAHHLVVDNVVMLDLGTYNLLRQEEYGNWPFGTKLVILGSTMALETATETARGFGRPIFVMSYTDWLYRRSLPYTNTIHLTIMHDDKVSGDALFPNLTERDWRLVADTAIPRQHHEFDSCPTSRRVMKRITKHWQD